MLAIRITIPSKTARNRRSLKTPLGTLMRATDRLTRVGITNWVLTHIKWKGELRVTITKGEENLIIRVALTSLIFLLTTVINETKTKTKRYNISEVKIWKNRAKVIGGKSELQVLALLGHNLESKHVVKATLEVVSYLWTLQVSREGMIPLRTKDKVKLTNSPACWVPKSK